MTVECVLVPVDGSEEALTAVEHAAAVADRYGADVHALYVVGSETAREIRAGDLEREAVAEGASRFFEQVRAVCSRRSVAVSSSTAAGFSTGRLTRHPGSVILDCAEEADADFVVVPRERAVDAPEALEKAAEYVLSYASQPVLAV
ncbi:universal stress protein UspA [Halobacteriales archaeon QS_8_69_26]|nr:MAG: universal stress protein UspA [Halobacteriales archaeon QS_8_69_26]